jgi:hypothetical protein
MDQSGTSQSANSLSAKLFLPHSQRWLVVHIDVTDRPAKPEIAEPAKASQGQGSLNRFAA